MNEPDKRYIFSVECNNYNVRKFESYCLMNGIWFKLRNSFTLINLENVVRDGK